MQSDVVIVSANLIQAVAHLLNEMPAKMTRAALNELEQQCDPAWQAEARGNLVLEQLAATKSTGSAA